MATTISLEKETRDRLAAAKLEGGYRSFDDLVRELLADYRLRRLREASDMLRRRAKAKGLTLKDLVR
jgi:predicted CopG family antitoxin